MAETDFSKATLNKYLSLINDKAQENQLALSIELEDEHLRLLVGADTKGVTFGGLFGQFDQVPTIDLFTLSWPVSSPATSSGAL